VVGTKYSLNVRDGDLSRTALQLSGDRPLG